jgi:hypothetical protein
MLLLFPREKATKDRPLLYLCLNDHGSLSAGDTEILYNGVGGAGRKGDAEFEQKAMRKRVGEGRRKRLARVSFPS